MRAVCLVALIALATSNTASGRELTVIGAGNGSCGTWVEAHQGAPSAIGIAQQNWVFGYVAAFSSFALSMGTPDASRMADGDGMTHWMTNYCVAHPLDTIYKAADELFADLMGRATKH